MIVAVAGAGDDGEAPVVGETRPHDAVQTLGVEERVFVQDRAVEIDPPHSLVGERAAVEPDGRAAGEDRGEFALEVADARDRLGVLLEVAPT